MIFIRSCILVFSGKKVNGGTPLNGPLVMDKSEILYSLVI